jgi:hypothetical protein
VSIFTSREIDSDTVPVQDHLAVNEGQGSVLEKEHSGEGDVVGPEKE